MQAVLLAAGTGNRLGSLTTNLPKALLPLAGRTILDYVLQTILALPLKELIVVGGFEFERLEKALRERKAHIRPVKNSEFLKGSILTLQKALPFLDDDFFLFNADHIFPPAMATFLKPLNGIRAVCDFDRPLTDDDMKVARDARGRLTAISKKLTPYDGGYIGITFCSRETLPLYRETAEEVSTATEGRGVVEEILARLIEKGKPPEIIDASGIPWIEIDTPEDLSKAEPQIIKVTDFKLPSEARASRPR